MRKKHNPNPHLETYYRQPEIDKPELNDALMDEVEQLASEYIYRTGSRPSRDMIKSWLRRLKLAYHKKQLTYLETK